MPDPDAGADQIGSEDQRAPQASPAADRVSEIVAEWARVYLANSPISRSVETWNLVVEALPHLVASLKKG